MAGRVLILHTGGTIGMDSSPEGFRPAVGFGERLHGKLRTTAHGRLPEFDVVEQDELIDSANLRPAHWQTIADALLARWDEYDGFVVLHGTDTMAWTASALSFILRGADKPVIFTGSQIPLAEARSDAVENLHAALLLAGTCPIREVCLYFNHRLLRGNRSRKLKSSGFDAFDSPNWPPLAEVGIDITLHRDRMLPAAPRLFVTPAFASEAVAVLALYPGISARVVEAVLDSPSVRGLILRSYGVGNAPNDDPQLTAALARASARGVVILNTTQCITGGVAQGAYATGALLARSGVVSGGNMTPEAAFAKLHFLLATESDAQTVRRRLAQPLCGELN